MRTPAAVRRRLGLAWLVAFACGGALVGVPWAQLDVNLGGLDEQNAESYLMPLPSAFSSALGSGTFRTGRVPLEGFHLEIGLQAMSVGFDDEDRTYLPVDPPGFIHAEEREVPTVVGDTRSVSVAGQANTSYPFPGGFDLEYFVAGAPEIRIGSIAGTRAILRYLAIDLGDADLGKLELLGFGIEHSLSQYLPNVPVDLAAGVLYQSFAIGDILDSNFLQLRVTGSRELSPYLEPYAGLGYDSFGLSGEYTYTAEGGDEKVELEFDRENSLHAVIGVNLRLGPVALNSEYNLAAESGVTVGLTFGR